MLLDTASMYFRAFYGVPEIAAPDGTNVNAVRGLMDFISRLVDDYRPTDLVCCWDNDWRPQWRVDLIPSYKAHRVVEEVATRAGRRGGPGPPRGPDPDHHRRAGRVRDLRARCRRLRGRRRDRHPRHRAPGSPSTSSPATATCSSWSTTTPRCGCSTSPAAWAATSGSPTTGCARSTASTPVSTPTSPPCGVTRPTGSPESRVSARRPRPRCWNASATSPGIVAAANDPDCRHGPRPARQDQGGRRLPGGRADRGRGRPRHRPRPQQHPAPPSRPRTPTRSRPSPSSGGSAALRSGSPRR